MAFVLASMIEPTNREANPVRRAKRVGGDILFRYGAERASNIFVDAAADIAARPYLRWREARVRAHKTPSHA